MVKTLQHILHKLTALSQWFSHSRTANQTIKSSFCMQDSIHILEFLLPATLLQAWTGQACVKSTDMSTDGRGISASSHCTKESRQHIRAMPRWCNLDPDSVAQLCPSNKAALWHSNNGRAQLSVEFWFYWVKWLDKTHLINVMTFT